MTTTTIEDQLADARRRIDQLQALAQVHAVAERPRLQRHLDALQREEASVTAVTRRPPDEIEANLGRLRTRLAVAEYSVMADTSDDWATFAAAVEDELRSWDTYLERIQATVAARAWKVREQAETAIGEVRSRRIAVHERLVQAGGAGDTRQEQRNRVMAAREELEQKAADLSTKLK